MKIAIFGDSFADCNRGGSSKNYDASWPALLRDNQDFEVHNYAKLGSGLDWSVNNCMKFQEGYEKIIFVFTNAERLTLNKEFHHKLDNPEQDMHIIPSFPVKSSNRFYNKIFNIASKYQYYFHQGDYVNNRTAAYYISLRKIFKNRILLLNATSLSAESTEKFSLLQSQPDNDLSLIDIFYHENKILFDGKDPAKNQELWKYDSRSCHLTHWHHNIVYEKILEWIKKGKFSLTENDLLDLDVKEAQKQYIKEW